jgi:hypothetical protein
MVVEKYALQNIWNKQVYDVKRNFFRAAYGSCSNRAGLVAVKPERPGNTSTFYLAAFLKPEFTMTIFTCFACASSVVEPAY